ncbi:glycosyltransferase family 4 protein [Arthrobacter sp. D3-18]
MPSAQKQQPKEVRTLIVVPWLEGGGAQGALEGILGQLPAQDSTLLILFSGNRNHDSVKKLVARTVELGLPRNPLGVLKAALQIRGYVRDSSSIYSLMRGSHLVLGLLPSRAFAGKRLAASFHQLPSTDSSGTQGKVEDVLVKRGVRRAGLITAPSNRAVHELIEFGFGDSRNVKVEHNIIKLATKPPVSPRTGTLEAVRLVFAGRISKQKGLDRLPELLGKVNVPVHIRCLGDGEEKQRVTDLHKNLNPIHTFEVLSHVDDVTSHLDWSDAVIMPSRWELNPLVVWEARARGRATIGSRIEAFQDLEKNGPMWLFGDALEFEKIISTLATQPDVRVKAFDDALESSQNLNTRSSIVDYLGS